MHVSGRLLIERLATTGTCAHEVATYVYMPRSDEGYGEQRLWVETLK